MALSTFTASFKRHDYPFPKFCHHSWSQVLFQSVWHMKMAPPHFLPVGIFSFWGKPSKCGKEGRDLPVYDCRNLTRLLVVTPFSHAQGAHVSGWAHVPVGLPSTSGKGWECQSAEWRGRPGRGTSVLTSLFLSKIDSFGKLHYFRYK